MQLFILVLVCVCCVCVLTQYVKDELAALLDSEQLQAAAAAGVDDVMMMTGCDAAAADANYKALLSRSRQLVSRLCSHCSNSYLSRVSVGMLIGGAKQRLSDVCLSRTSGITREQRGLGRPKLASLCL